jgi:hypothetical protein
MGKSREREKAKGRPFPRALYWRENNGHVIVYPMVNGEVQFAPLGGLISREPEKKAEMVWDFFVDLDPLDCDDPFQPCGWLIMGNCSPW